VAGEEIAEPLQVGHDEEPAPVIEEDGWERPRPVRAMDDRLQLERTTRNDDDCSGLATPGLA
jgi:hypothetical protein